VDPQSGGGLEGVGRLGAFAGKQARLLCEKGVLEMGTLQFFGLTVAVIAIVFVVVRVTESQETKKRRTKRDDDGGDVSSSFWMSGDSGRKDNDNSGDGWGDSGGSDSGGDGGGGD
jgi:uncharacterized membrane protein YgcG